MSKDKWSALSTQERAQLINIYVQSGITDLDFIKKHYNSFDEGGSIEYAIPSPKDDDINVPYKSVITSTMREDFISKSKNKFDAFVEKMYPIVERSLVDAGHSTDNLNNILRQMAQESNYGLSPRGNGYNLSGIKAWDSKEGTKHKDGYYYRNFKDYKDYADYHVALLNNRYDALNAEDTKDFVYRLHHTKDGRKYSGDERGYMRNLNRMSSLDNAIKKYESNNYSDGGRILDGTSEENQTLDNTPWYKKVSSALIEGARMGRDARIGAIGAEPLREMYANGQVEEADRLAKQYVRANTTGIGIGAGAVTSNILGDALVTVGTAGLDTLLEDDINFNKVTSNIGKAIAADVVTRVIGGIPTVIKSIRKTKEKLVPSSVKDVIKYIKTKDDRILDKDNLVELINNASKEDLDELTQLTGSYDGDWGLIQPLVDAKLGNLMGFFTGLNDAMYKMRHGKTTSSKFIDDATGIINDAWNKYISSGGANGLSLRNAINSTEVLPAKKYLSHGISVSNFRKSLRSRNGEAIMPSLAILPQDVESTWARGNILFIGDKSLLDRSIIYGYDAWTPTVGKIKDVESKTNKQILEEMLKIPNERDAPILSIDDVDKTIWNRELPTEEVQQQNSFTKWFFDRVPTKSISSGTPYMEAKYQDVLPFTSFKHAVIPVDAADVIEWAKTNKIPYTTYDKVTRKGNLTLYPTIQKVLDDDNLLFNKGGFLQNNYKN